MCLLSVSQTHAAGRFIAEVDTDAEKICGAGGFTALAANTVLCTWGRGDLPSPATIPGHHFENIEGTGANALGASDAGVVNLDGVGHLSCSGVNGLK